MKTYIALIRGINVGGHHILPMKELRALLETLGFKNVRTYIQSGNVVLQHDDSEPEQLAEIIRTSIGEQFGFEPRVLVLNREGMKKAIADNPFPEAENDPRTLHLFFLTDQPVNPNLENCESLKNETERFKLQDQVFYLHTPDGIGRSKLAAKIEKNLGVSATARNWRTVQKIMEMVEILP